MAGARVREGLGRSAYQAAQSTPISRKQRFNGGTITCSRLGLSTPACTPLEGKKGETGSESIALYLCGGKEIPLYSTGTLNKKAPIEKKKSPIFIIFYHILKGTVRRDVTRVKKRLKQFYYRTI
jgi:hypothetical protein